jgi:PAS domain S-box-containing protein
MSASIENVQARPNVAVLIARFTLAFSIVFMAELISDRMLPGLFSDESALVLVLADSIVILVISVPSFWWLIYRPMRVSPLVRDAQLKLKQSEDRFRNIFEQSEDAILLFIPGTCTIFDVNATTERLYGYSKNQLTGLCFNLFRSKPECSDFVRSVCMLTDGESCQLDHIVNLKSDGNEIHLSVRAKVIKLQGQDVIYCTMRDITHRLQMEEEARSIQAQMIHSNKMTSLGLLVAGIAHEINNPNNYIMANAQMLYKIWKDLDPLLKEEAERKGDYILGGLPYSRLEESLPEMITAINEGSRRIRDIIAGLKNYTRQGKTAMECLDINGVVNASMLLLKHHVNKYTDNFVVELESGIPQIRGSSQQLEQVIINLVMNALQSLTDKSQCVSLKTSLLPDKKAVSITTVDEGCGIPKNLRDKIMEPFFTTRLDSGGTGLGLSIARTIVLAHHGEIEVSSIYGQGTAVTVSIPVSADE